MATSKQTSGCKNGSTVMASTKTAIVRQTVALTESVPGVLQTSETLTFQMGPEEIVLIQRVAFQPGLTTDEITRGIGRIRQTIQDTIPAIRQVFIEPVQLP